MCTSSCLLVCAFKGFVCFCAGRLIHVLRFCLTAGSESDANAANTDNTSAGHVSMWGNSGHVR